MMSCSELTAGIPGAKKRPKLKISRTTWKLSVNTGDQPMKLFEIINVPYYLCILEHVTVPVFPGPGPQPKSGPNSVGAGIVRDGPNSPGAGTVRNGPDIAGAGALRERSCFARSRSRFLVQGPGPGPNL
jgi:hypothetical protein